MENPSGFRDPLFTHSLSFPEIPTGV